MLNVARGGAGYDLSGAIAAFLRRVQGGERAIEGEAKRLLRALRLTDGVVPVRVRTVLLGFSFEEPVALPFGQLFAATRSDLALRGASGSEPPASVFETVVDAPAAVGGAGQDPWTAAAREHAELALEAADEPLGRLMVSLACSYANPVQERMVWVGPLYSGSQVGRGAIPIGSAWTSAPDMGYPTLELDRLAQATGPRGGALGVTGGDRGDENYKDPALSCAPARPRGKKQRPLSEDGAAGLVRPVGRRRVPRYAGSIGASNVACRGRTPI